MKLKYLFLNILTLSIIFLSNAQCVSGPINSSIWGTPDDFAFGFTSDADITDIDTVQVVQGNDTIIYVDYLLPKKQHITSPITGDATVTSVQILGVTGLPTGMNWILDAAANGANNTYYPQTYRYGTVTLCGTTFSTPGVKTLTVTVDGCGSLSGISDCAPASFPLYIEVLPGQGGNSAFTFTPTVGCNSLEVDFEAIFQSPDPVLYPLDFNWDLGDGTTATGSTITAHNYSTPGVYPVKLEVVINEFYISGASVVCSGGWYPDIEELTALQSPEPYLILNGTQTSSGSGASYSWTGLDITLSSTTINGQTKEEDTGGLLGSADDDLGSGSTTIIPSDGGTYAINTANSIISVTVNERVSSILEFWDTIKVFSNSIATITSSNGTVFCGGDSTILDLGSSNFDFIQWYNDTTLLLGENSQTLNVSTSGNYFAEILNSGNICSGTSNTIAITTDNILMTAIVQTANGLEIDNPDGYDVQWFSNGVPIPGATSDVLADLSSGNPFTVSFTNANNCMALSMPVDVCIGGYATAPNGTDMDGDIAKTFEAVGFTYDSQTEIAWSVTPVDDGMITSVADVDNIADGQVYLGNGNEIDLLLNCSTLGSGDYYLTPFLIEKADLPEFPYPYSDTTCIPTMDLGIEIGCDDQDWAIDFVEITSPEGNIIDAFSLSPIPITPPIMPSLICGALGGNIPDINLFKMDPNSNPNGIWKIAVKNSGTGNMYITIPQFEVSLLAGTCSDITDDMVFTYGPYEFTIEPDETQSISITVPPIPDDFPTIANTCSAFGTPVELQVTNCVNSIEDLINADNINLFPNPNNGKFTLDFDVYEQNDITISIVDVTGRMILNSSYNNIRTRFSRTFDLKNNLNTGFYIMNIQVGNYSTQKKFIVK